MVHPGRWVFPVFLLLLAACGQPENPGEQLVVVDDALLESTLQVGWTRPSRRPKSRRRLSRARPLQLRLPSHPQRLRPRRRNLCISVCPPPPIAEWGLGSGIKERVRFSLRPAHRSSLKAQPQIFGTSRIRIDRANTAGFGESTRPHRETRRCFRSIHPLQVPRRAQPSA